MVIVELLLALAAGTGRPEGGPPAVALPGGHFPLRAPVIVISTPGSVAPPRSDDTLPKEMRDSLSGYDGGTTKSVLRLCLRLPHLATQGRCWR
jgi:hypothetical protein